MRIRESTLAWILLGIFLLVVFAVLSAPHGRSKGSSQRASCQSYMKQIMLGMIAYNQDYDNRFPLAQGDRLKNDARYGWAGSTQPYLKSTEILHCASLQTPTALHTGDRGFSDYYYNRRLSGFEEKNLNRVSETIAVGDGNDRLELADAAYSKRDLPTIWFVDSDKPTFRHLGGANYGFVDGHVKWLKPDELRGRFALAARFTFAVK